MMHGLNTIDYIFLIIFACFAFAGFARGLVREITNTITLVAAFIIAGLFSHPLAAMVTKSAGLHQTMSASPSISAVAVNSVSYAAIGVAYSLLFVLTMLIGSVLGYFINFAIEGRGISLGNRLFGAIFGIFKSLIIVLVIIFLLQLTPINNQINWKQSVIVRAYQPMVLWLNHFISPSMANLKNQLNNTMNSVSSSIKKVSSSPETLKNLVGQ